MTSRARQPRRYSLDDPAIARLPVRVTDPSRDPARPGRDIAYTGRCAVCAGPVEDDAATCSSRCEFARRRAAAVALENDPDRGAA